MPLVRHGRPRLSTRSRRAAPVFLVAHWLRRAIQHFRSGRDKYTVPATAHESLCAHLRRIIYAQLPEIRSAEQWRASASQYTRALWGLIEDNVLVAWCRVVKSNSPAPTLQQLIDRRHQMHVSVAYARLVQ
eukprot:10379-Heterococcus_DN1.PRE.1